VANATGLKIILGGGFYVSAFHPPDMDKRTVEEMTELIIDDITRGAEGTRVRTGIIGEVGVQGAVLEVNEIKSIRASARASRATGAPISFHHGGRDEAKFQTLDIVEEEGGDLSRVIIGHANHIAGQIPYMKRLLERGVYLQFDLFGEVIPRLGRIHDAEVIAGIRALIEAGYGDRILVSQDVCTKTQLKKYGGMGFSYVMEFVLPEMRRLGVTEEQIYKIMVDNPRHILTFATPKQP
jgi:phosphotriesterase-related protein